MRITLSTFAGRAKDTGRTASVYMISGSRGPWRTHLKLSDQSGFWLRSKAKIYAVYWIPYELHHKARR
jgi:hypothetical protein